jgi:hypothetical protein
MILMKDRQHVASARRNKPNYAGSLDPKENIAVCVFSVVAISCQQNSYVQNVLANYHVEARVYIQIGYYLDFAHIAVLTWRANNMFGAQTARKEQLSKEDLTHR